MISPLYAANNMIRRAVDQGINLTNLKLQKLLYLLYTRYMFDVKAALFPNRFEAWQYGPVLTDIYDIFKIEGASPITELRPDANGKIYIVSEKEMFGDCFDRIWSNYARKSASYLVSLTHGDENPNYKTAWHKAYEISPGAFLDDDDITEDGEEWFGRDDNGVYRRS
jgi:uncharacterized phage-associated protein